MSSFKVHAIPTQYKKYHFQNRPRRSLNSRPLAVGNLKNLIESGPEWRDEYGFTKISNLCRVRIMKKL